MKQKHKSLSSQMRNSSNNMSGNIKLPPHQTLPSLFEKSASVSTIGSYEAAPIKGDRNTFNRLSGLVDPISTSGLYSEIHLPQRPVHLCVRCSDAHPSVCMPCCELICENTLTFYRKTRAAGAAALFTKAFVEAGNSKLVKFFIFRLLKNSYEARIRKKQKMKSVVERLFGTNIVYIPFAAWRRFTKENIVERKEKKIHDLQDKISGLESQINKLFVANKKQEEEIEKLQSKNASKDAETKLQASQISALKALLTKEKERIIGLSALAQPLHHYSQLSDSLLSKESGEVRSFLTSNATAISSHNFSHIFKPSVLQDLGKLYRDKESISKRSNSVDVGSADLRGGKFSSTDNNKSISNVNTAANEHTIKIQILIDWFKAISYQAGQQVDKSSGKSYGLFLPQNERITTLSDIKTGRDLIRVVVNLIMDYKKHHEANSISQSVNAASAGSRVHGGEKKSGSNKPTTRSPKEITLVDLNYIKKHQDNAFELIEFAVKLAKHALNTPNFKPTDIYSGKQDTIYLLLTSLMMCCDPVVYNKEQTELGNQMTKYQEFTTQQAKLIENKGSIVHLTDITSMLQQMELSQTQQNSPHRHGVNFNLNSFDRENSNNSNNNNNNNTTSEGKDSENIMNGSNAERPAVLTRTDTSTSTASETSKFSIQLSRQLSMVSSMMVNTEPNPLSKILPMDENYTQLTLAIDLFLQNKEQEKLSQLAKENIDASHALFELVTQTTQSKEKREIGIRATTEIKQFILYNHFNNTANKLGYTVGGRVGDQYEGEEGSADDEEEDEDM